MSLQNDHSRIIAFGTPDPIPVSTSLTAGALSVEIINGIARGLRWNGVEVIRVIDCPIRDERWGTYAAESAEEKIGTSDDAFSFERRYVIAGGALSCRLVFIGQVDGIFRASVELTAVREFRTNRAGFTVLHPIRGIAGSPLTVMHSDGSVLKSEFPRLILPSQPAFDIAGLVHSVEGAKVTITFEGEIFEMEDQRNWSDASYKTYCRPLSRPMPYLIAAGETVKQEIEISLSGGLAQPKNPTEVPAAVLKLEHTNELIPAIALAVDSTSVTDVNESSLARRVAPQILQLRVRPETVDRVLEWAEAWVDGDKPEIELEIVVPESQQIEECLEQIAQQFAKKQIPIARVIALPEVYLRSYQPNGPWPAGLTPQEAAVAARKWFPGARIGGGVLTNFTELNRCRPDMSFCSFITHSTTAIVHAADDRSVIESLEGLSQVFISARAMASDGDYRLGLVCVGMRFNPYGSGTAGNPAQIRLPMAEIDPRQRGLFAAAWAVGAIAMTEQQRISSMALAMPVGPFGIIYRRAVWPQPIYDDRTGTAVYPLFHVVRELSRIGNFPRLSVGGVPHGVVGVAGETPSGGQLILANLSAESRNVILPHKALVRRLDEDTFGSAIIDPDWLMTSEPEHLSKVSLGAYAVAFVDFGSSAI